MVPSERLCIALALALVAIFSTVPPLIITSALERLLIALPALALDVFSTTPPSIKLIEKAGRVLGVEPWRFFIDETVENQEKLDETINLLNKLSDQQRLKIINRISKSLQ